MQFIRKIFYNENLESKYKNLDLNMLFHLVSIISNCSKKEILFLALKRNLISKILIFNQQEIHCCSINIFNYQLSVLIKFALDRTIL